MDVKDFLKVIHFMSSKWSQEMAVKIYGKDLGNHFFAKWANKKDADLGTMTLFYEMTDHNLQLLIDEAMKTYMPSPIVKQFLSFKKKFPNTIILFRIGDFYETYMQDAEQCAKILGITLTKSRKTKDPEGKPLALSGFPYHALDYYLPRLIRAGLRVSICDAVK